MKQLLYWVMGDRTARIMVATWHWLLGIPLEGNPQIAKEVAKESLLAMQASVTKFTEAVATVSSSHQQAKAIYERKLKEFKHAERQALLAHQKDEEETAHLAMARALQIEALLPQLQERVTQAKQLEEQMLQKLKLERQKLEHYKGEMQNLEALTQVNQALEAGVKTSSDLEVGTAKAQFDQANRIIQNQHFKSSSLAELSQNPTDVLENKLNRLTLKEEINRRFKQLDQPPTNPSDN
jgi:phage shock protein A